MTSIRWARARHAYIAERESKLERLPRPIAPHRATGFDGQVRRLPKKSKKQIEMERSGSKPIVSEREIGRQRLKAERAAITAYQLERRKLKAKARSKPKGPKRKANPPKRDHFLRAPLGGSLN